MVTSFTGVGELKSLVRKAKSVEEPACCECLWQGLVSLAFAQRQ